MQHLEIRAHDDHADTLILTGRFDGRSTTEARDKLYAHIAAHPEGDVVLDLSGVELLDLAALNLLAAATHHVERQHRHLVLRGCSPALRRLVLARRWRRLFQIERTAVPA